MQALFQNRSSCLLIGMIHLQPLPGSPGWTGAKGSMQQIRDAALRDADVLLQGGCDGLLVENMGDLPFLRGRVEPETVAAMAILTEAIVRLGHPTGVQVLAGANREALGIAISAGASFLRAEAFAYAHIADEGFLQASAGELLRARSALRSDVSIWADIQKKHSAHAITSDLSLAEIAKGNAFCGADALIVTGIATGEPTSPDDVMAAKTAKLPVIVGSGVTPENAASLGSLADALIVGTFFKEDGDWRKPVSLSRVRALRSCLS